VCGGCAYQHSNYEFQLGQKREILLENLRRLGRIHYTGEINVFSAAPWHYRNRIQLHFAHGQIGFHRAGSNQLAPVEECFITSPLLTDAIKILSKAVRQREWPGFLNSLELFSNETEIQINVLDSSRPVAQRFFDWLKTILPTAPGAIDYEAAGHAFRISRDAFFQVNRFLIHELVKEVVGDKTGQRAIDLYAGVGLFSLPLAQRFQTVAAVERGGPASRDLEYNARRAGRDGINVIRSTSEEFLRSAESPDLLVADPPRAGLGNAVVEGMIRLRAAHTVIVSCDPSTLARDLKRLSTGFRIVRLTLIDLFPQTYHLETVAHLEPQ
jgi:23S rRNA (uracil1939-C5)-methyltransferase